MSNNNPCQCEGCKARREADDVELLDGFTVGDFKEATLTKCNDIIAAYGPKRSDLEAVGKDKALFDAIRKELTTAYAATVVAADVLKAGLVADLNMPDAVGKLVDAIVDDIKEELAAEVADRAIRSIVDDLMTGKASVGDDVEAARASGMKVVVVGDEPDLDTTSPDVQ